MASVKPFRSAFNGFNREDVVAYIEYLNNHHNAQIEQLNSQLQNALSKPGSDADLQAKLDEALARCAQLEAQLQQTPAAQSDTELEAYRRAEKAERLARDRAQQIHDQANAVLADTTAKLEQAAQQMAQQLEAYEACVADSKAVLQDATAALAAIRPEE